MWHVRINSHRVCKRYAAQTKSTSKMALTIELKIKVFKLRCHFKWFSFLSFFVKKNLYEYKECDLDINRNGKFGKIAMNSSVTLTLRYL